MTAWVRHEVHTYPYCQLWPGALNLTDCWQASSMPGDRPKVQCCSCTQMQTCALRDTLLLTCSKPLRKPAPRAAVRLAPQAAALQDSFCVLSSSCL